VPKNKYIRQLIAQGENQHLDFKYEVSDAKKLARTFSAFANTGGGTLLIGVKDNGVIRGIEIEEEAYMLEAAATFYCKPKVPYKLKDWHVDGKELLEVTIEESSDKPHLAPWKDKLWRAFVRVKDENFVANAIQVAVWKNKNREKGTLIKYNDIEKELLVHLRQHGEITVREFCQVCRIRYPLAKKILVNLISIGVLYIHYNESVASYRLAQ
jgi:predicted HTH transcriptional regulator